MNPQQPTDIQALNLTKAMRRAETGSSTDPYNQKGASGESGAYQFMPKTWAAWSKEFLGQENAPMTVENQNKVAYSRVKKWKDEGYSPAQIASLWNSGDPDAYKNGKRGVNSQGVSYDVPAHVQRVSDYYREISGSTTPQAGIGAQVAPSVPGLPPPPPVQTSIGGQSTAPQQEQDGILETIVKDPIKTLLVKPADRFAEAIGRTGILGEDIKRGYEEMSDKGESRTFAGIEVEPQKAFGEGGAAQIAGDVLKSGSYLYTGGKVPGLVQQGMKGNIVRAGLQGAKTGAITGAAYGAGEGLHQGQDAQGVLTQAAIGGGLGLATGGVLGGAGGAIGTVLNKNQVIKDMIRSDVDTLLKNGRAMTNATALVRKKNVPIEEVLSDPEVFRGLKVEGNKIEPDDALAVLDERIDAMMGAKGKLLKEFDRTLMPIAREAVRQRAKEAVTKLSPLDEAQLMRAIDEQINALPESMSPSQLDDFRARFRNSARNARGLQKSDSEYAALENATRDVLFDVTGNLPKEIDAAGDFAQLNNEIKNLITAREFIDKTLRGRNAPGAGWAREALARVVGGMAGGSHGPLGVILGSEAGRVISNIIANKNLGNSFKMKLIKEMTDEPEVLKAAKELLGKAQDYNPVAQRLALPSPKAIPVGPAGSTRPQQPMQVVTASKGVPGQVPSGKPGAGRFFKTYSSTPEGLVPPSQNRSNPAIVPFGSAAGVEQNEEGEVQVDPLKATLGMGVAGVLSRGKGGAEVFKNFADLSTKLLGKLEGKGTVSKQFIADLTNSPDLKQPERDLIRRVLEKEGNTVNVPEFAEKVKDELLPLTPKNSWGTGKYGKGTPYNKYEGITLPEELRGPVSKYTENIYQSPIKTSAGGVHFSTEDTPNYFAHSRIEDMADGQTRRVIEAQSDLFQKGRLEESLPNLKRSDELGSTPVRTRGMSQEEWERLLDERDAARSVVSPEAQAELAKLEPYRNTWHERIVREEVKKAAQDGKTKLQFPTGETAMKIEGLGTQNQWLRSGTDGDIVTPFDIKAGEIIYPRGGTNWVVTNVLENGKFEAVPKRFADEYKKSGGNIIGYEGVEAETFDISGKVDTENPIYKFYEKEMGKYLKNKYGAQLVTDDQGVTWWEVPVKKEQANLPVEAFGAAPLMALPQKKEEEKKKGLVPL